MESISRPEPVVARLAPSPPTVGPFWRPSAAPASILRVELAELDQVVLNEPSASSTPDGASNGRRPLPRQRSRSSTDARSTRRRARSRSRIRASSDLTWLSRPNCSGSPGSTRRPSRRSAPKLKQQRRKLCHEDGFLLYKRDVDFSAQLPRPRAYGFNAPTAARPRLSAGSCASAANWAGLGRNPAQGVLPTPHRAVDRPRSGTGFQPAPPGSRHRQRFPYRSRC